MYRASHDVIVPDRGKVCVAVGLDEETDSQ